MERSTIDFVSTWEPPTSCIAVLEGITSRIIKLSERRDFIPSMVSYNKRVNAGRL